MSSIEVKKIYGLMIEHNLNDSLYNDSNEIPEEDKLEIKKGINDLKKGKKEKAEIFIKRLKANYA